MDFLYSFWLGYVNGRSFPHLFLRFNYIVDYSILNTCCFVNTDVLYLLALVVELYVSYVTSSSSHFYNYPGNGVLLLSSYS